MTILSKNAIFRPKTELEAIARWSVDASREVDCAYFCNIGRNSGYFLLPIFLASYLTEHSQSPNNGILKNNCYNTPTSTSQYFLVLGPPEVRRPQYEKILASRGQEASIRENIG